MTLEGLLVFIFFIYMGIGVLIGYYMGEAQCPKCNAWKCERTGMEANATGEHPLGMTKYKCSKCGHTFWEDSPGG